MEFPELIFEKYKGDFISLKVFESNLEEYVLKNKLRCAFIGKEIRQIHIHPDVRLSLFYGFNKFDGRSENKENILNLYYLNEASEKRLKDIRGLIDSCDLKRT